MEPPGQATKAGVTGFVAVNANAPRGLSGLHKLLVEDCYGYQTVFRFDIHQFDSLC